LCSHLFAIAIQSKSNIDPTTLRHDETGAIMIPDPPANNEVQLDVVDMDIVDTAVALDIQVMNLNAENCRDLLNQAFRTIESYKENKDISYQQYIELATYAESAGRQMKTKELQLSRTNFGRQKKRKTPHDMSRIGKRHGLTQKAAKHARNKVNNTPDMVMFEAFNGAVKESEHQAVLAMMKHHGHAVPFDFPVPGPEKKS
jgi:hypothetical protein